MYRTLILVLSLCSLPAAAWGQPKTPLPRGHVFLATDFEEPKGLQGWTGKATLEAGFESARALAITRSADSTTGSGTVQLTLPVEQLRGYIVNFSAMIKAENVSVKPQPWNGVKFMAPVVTPGGKNWPAATLPAGTFAWQKVAFRATVPADATAVSLVLGLEAVTGKAWYDNIRVTVWKAPPVRPERPATGPVYKGHDVPRLRGAMVGPEIDEEGLRVFGRDWNANLIRWQLIRRGPIADPLDMAAYERWLQSALKQFDAAVPHCQKYGLRVVLDLHSPPGGRSTSGGYAGSDHGLFTSAACQQKFVEVWQHMARRYQDTKIIWGYDLANEPVEEGSDEGLADWQELAERAAKAIRAIDPERTIIVEPPQWGGPSGLAELQPLSVPNVVYSVHMYNPGGFTHQGVHSQGPPVSYPGRVDGKNWDKAQLEASLRPVVDFQKAYGVHMYLGEFSAIRWAPDDSAYRYLKDLIDIFESHDWDWTYHAFREWDGWSVEHGSDRNDHRRSTTPTTRQQLLRSWFTKNTKS